MKNTKISFIIPIYNAEKHLKRCIKSIQKQTYSNLEIICINDGSSDNSLVILQKLAEKDQRIKIINQENSGAFMARKAGILASTGEYIMFVDADDKLCNNRAVEIFIDIFKNNPVQLIQFEFKKKKGFISINSSLSIEGIVTKEQIKNRYYKDYLSSESESVIRVSMCNKVFNGDLLRKTVENLTCSIRLGEDLLMFLRYLKNEEVTAIYNINLIAYAYYMGIGCSSRLDGTILKEYGELKKYQLEICDEWNLPNDAKYFCNLESIYFLLSAVTNMIENKIDKQKVLEFIDESQNYDIIITAKQYFNSESDDISDELKFLASEYSAEQYYQLASSRANNKTLKKTARRLLTKLLKLFN